MEINADAIHLAGEEFFSECTRVGFGIRELGALLISDRTEYPRLGDAMTVLRALPVGAGFKAFCDRVPGGAALWAAHEERVAAEKRQPTRCNFCRRPATSERRLVRGAGQVAICRECARQALRALD